MNLHSQKHKEWSGTSHKSSASILAMLFSTLKIHVIRKIQRYPVKRHSDDKKYQKNLLTVYSAEKYIRTRERNKKDRLKK